MPIAETMQPDRPLAHAAVVATGLATMRRALSGIGLLRCVETVAAGFGLAGMAFGSTTQVGIACYTVAIPCLIYCVYRKELWGLLMLNLAQVAVIGFNAWRAF